ncbi:MAG: signal recognition particle-docking protein FtsY [Planctomycetota bacterium]|nr:signal recognition particle-docking protein FtsY [Planctomycetota bacterium]MCX8039226.1 signal recognition particle-docking protein FtsY [Planctomycetota bacterium]MDW8372665.1 signal recognition particle-docking protein FtsY [Planctomycetota bacterium]
MFRAIGRFFERIKEGLSKTRQVIGGALRRLIGARRTIDAAFLRELEDTLLAADIGVAKTEEILADLQRRYRAGEVAEGEDLLRFLKASLRAELAAEEQELRFAAQGPTVVLVVGVNGAGKTTTVAKLAHRLRAIGRRPLVAAADTYRAAAIEQLSVWAQRARVEIVKGEPGGDAAAVAYDAVAAAQARGCDTVLIDTAGRLHNKEHLMRELEKMRRVIQKRLPEAPHDVLLVLDATAGQNAVQQAKVFKEIIGVTGLVITKLDGTAKGGVAITVKRELGLTVRYIGVGEGLDDLQPFDPDAFVEAIFA